MELSLAIIHIAVETGAPGRVQGSVVFTTVSGDNTKFRELST